MQCDVLDAAPRAGMVVGEARHVERVQVLGAGRGATRDGNLGRDRPARDECLWRGAVEERDQALQGDASLPVQGQVQPEQDRETRHLRQQVDEER